VLLLEGLYKSGNVRKQRAGNYNLCLRGDHLLRDGSKVRGFRRVHLVGDGLDPTLLQQLSRSIDLWLGKGIILGGIGRGCGSLRCWQ
jgi:hypothetical protein